MQHVRSVCAPATPPHMFHPPGRAEVQQNPRDPCSGLSSVSLVSAGHDVRPGAEEEVLRGRGTR